jgi:hypothetical protein
MFPFKKVTIDLKTGEKIELDGDALDRALQYSPSVSSSSSSVVLVGLLK